MSNNYEKQKNIIDEYRNPYESGKWSEPRSLLEWMKRSKHSAQHESRNYALWQEPRNFVFKTVGQV